MDLTVFDAALSFRKAFEGTVNSLFFRSFQDNEFTPADRANLPYVFQSDTTFYLRMQLSFYRVSMALFLFSSTH